MHARAGSPVAASLLRAIAGIGLALLAALAVLAASGSVGAVDTIVAETDRSLDLSDRLEGCVTSAELTVAEVLAGACDFRPMTARDLAVGYSSEAHWVRTTLIGGATPQDRWLVVGHRRLQSVTYAVVSSGGDVRVVETGLSVPPAVRPADTSDPVLPLHLAPGDRVTVVARVVSQTSINLTTTLWSPRAHGAAEGRLEFWEAAAFGGLLAAALFSLTIALIGRVSPWSRLTNLWFGLLLLTKAVFNIANAALLAQRLMPRDWSYDVRVQALAMGASIVLQLFFLRQFLRTDRNDPKAEAVLRSMIVAVTLLTAWAVGIAYMPATRWLATASVVALVVSVVLFARSWRAGVPAAGYLLAAYVINLLQMAFRVVHSVGGGFFDDRLLLFYSWSYLVTVPLIPLGIALREEAARLEAEKAKAEVTARIEFLARVSHELRSPLDAILGNAQLLARPSGAPLLQEGLGIIGDSARHLLRMIDDLLDHARGMAGRLTLAPRPVDWPAFLAALEHTGRVMAARGGNAFALEVTGASPPVLGLDDDRLRQVLDNLLTNAARHTRDGRIVVACEVGRPDAEGRVVVAFAVSDTGEGIAPADRERIFLPFERGGAASRSGGKGFGMGLTIARQLVEIMGGRLTVESRPNEGATFRFTVVSEPLGSRVPESVETAFASPELGRGRSILIVDDGAASLLILVRLFREHGFDVHEATSGRAAIDVCRERAIDLVITDLFMADGDGWYVSRKLADLQPKTPVVVVSAAPIERPAEVAATVGFAAEFLRPLDHGRLLRTVADLLGLRIEASPPSSEAAPDETVVAPTAAERAVLRDLAADGRLGEVIRRVEAMRRRDPGLSAFAEAIRRAAMRVDMAELERRLAEGGDAGTPNGCSSTQPE